MKKFKIVLCLCACILGLSACGQSEENTLDVQTVTQVESIAQSLVTDFIVVSTEEDVEMMNEYGPEYLEEVFSSYFQINVDGNALINGMNSWNKASEEIGDFQGINGINAVLDDQGSDIIVTMDVSGTKKTAQIEAIFDGDMKHTLTSMTTNVNYTFGEKMSKAGLNTLMGMGTVFAILILISFIISLFKYIPNIQAAFAKKDKEDNATEKNDPAIAQIIEKEEELTDDLELIAVITAAIAASSQSGSSDDFIVRSIRRRR